MSSVAVFLRRRPASIAGIGGLTALNLALLATDAADARWVIVQVAVTAAALAAIFCEARR